MKHTLAASARSSRGRNGRQQDFHDLLSCVPADPHRAPNAVALEPHIEDPRLAIFPDYPRILADSEAVTLICDTCARRMNTTTRTRSRT